MPSAEWVREIRDAATVEEAVQDATNHQVDAILMDVRLPDGDGIEATRRIVQHCPDVRVLILTFYGDEGQVARAVRAGARGYVLKDTGPAAIIDALRTVAMGGVVFGPKVGSEVLTMLRRELPPLPAAFDSLTPREREILASRCRRLALARRLTWSMSFSVLDRLAWPT